jgi:hypothetical protein
MKLSDKWYNILKWTALIALPACAVLYSTLAGAWNLPYSDAIVTTLNAVGVFIGVLIGVSQSTINKTGGGGTSNG